MFEFDFSLLLCGQYYEMLAVDLLPSPKLAAVILVFVIPLAIPVALLRLMPFRALQRLGFTYVESIRSIPLLAYVLLRYFAASKWLPEDLKAWLYTGSIETASAVVALTLHTATFMSEDMRNDIRVAPTVQLGAICTLGFGYLASMRLVIPPQALQIAVPSLISQVLNLQKNTSIATMIDVTELTYRVGQVEGSTLRGFKSLAFVTVVYLSTSLLTTGTAAWHRQRHPGAERR